MQASVDEGANVWIRNRRDNFTGLLDSLADKQVLKGVRNLMTQICTMKCPHCGSTAIKGEAGTTALAGSPDVYVGVL